MAPSKHTRAGRAPTAAIVRRLAVYAVAAVALVIILWALIEGGERDLWSEPSVLVPVLGRQLPSR